MSLLVLSTHPIQYQAPVYRALQTQFDIPTTVIYGSDFSVAGYQDREFGVEFAWDTDLLSGYNAVFLSRVAEGGAGDDRSVSARGIEQAIRDANPSAILVQGYRPRFDMRAFWAARRTGVPLLFRAETSDVARSRSRIKHILRDGFLRWFYSQFARLLYIGVNSKSHYERLGCPAEKLVFSPYCVDTTPFRLTEDDRASLRLATRQELAIGSEKIVLLFVGKLAHRKGPDLLVQAVKGLPAALRETLVLIFLGDGELRASLESVVTQPPAVEAHFTGFKNQRQLSEYYHTADLLVVPSRTGETWGLVVNEGLHHGLPCVVSANVGSAADLVKPGRTGSVFSVGSTIELKQSIEYTLKLLEKPTIRQDCREIVSHYTVEEAARGIAEAFRSATQHQRPG